MVQPGTTPQKEVAYAKPSSYENAVVCGRFVNAVEQNFRIISLKTEPRIKREIGYILLK